MWVGKNCFPWASEVRPSPWILLPTAHLPLAHPCVPKDVFTQPLPGSVNYCTFLYVECWATQRDQLATNTSSEGHCCISAAQTFLLLYLQFHSQSCTRCLCFHLLPLSQRLCRSLDLSDLAGSLAALILYMLSQGHTHTHTHAAHPTMPLSSSPVSPGIPPEGFAVWIGVLETHLFQFTSPVQLIVACVGLFAKVLHVHADQHLPQLHKVTVSFILHCKKTW